MLLLVLLLVSISISTAIGPVYIDLPTIWGIFLTKLQIPVPVTWAEGTSDIILEIRLPRTIAALVVGAMLGIAGVAAQGIFKNPIAEPYIIGISSAASFGTAIAVTIGFYVLQMFTRPIISFIIAMLAVTIVYRLSQTRFKLSMSALLLSGIAISYFFSAATSYVLYMSPEQMHNVQSYILGSFADATWIEVYILCCVFVFGLIGLLYYGRDLNLLVFGDETAQTTGVDVEGSKKSILFIMTAMTAITVAFCGSIGFVGLIIPHLMRLVVGSNHRQLIPFSAVGGGLLLVWADILSRTLINGFDIPVGIFTALLGGPFFVYLVVKRKKEGELV